MSEKVNQPAPEVAKKLNAMIRKLSAEEIHEVVLGLKNIRRHLVVQAKAHNRPMPADYTAELLVSQN